MSSSGTDEFKPSKQEIENLIEMIKKSHIIAYEMTEYTYHIEKDNGEIDYGQNVYTGHREITFHIQQVYRKEGMKGFSAK